MANEISGVVSRNRRNGLGKMYVNPEIVRLIQGLSPKWQSLKGHKIADMVDRNLPSTPGGIESICFFLPGGKEKASIPLIIEDNPPDNSIHVQPNPNKKVKIHTV